ncbi:MAG: response regulator [Armatimonadota bacterium]
MDVTGKTVLVADDTQWTVDLLTVVLGDMGIKVEVAVDGEEAVAMAKRTTPDLILLDIMLPLMDGWEVATRLLTDSRTANIPIIFLTTRAGTSEQLRGWSMPVFEYITKPFEISDLVEKVKAVLSAEPEEKPELREQMRREKLRSLLGLKKTGEDQTDQGR